eukprot:7139714-Lingulodinium_polyedra.AAC.1
MADLSGGVDDFAAQRLLRSGTLTLGAAGALRLVLVGGVVVERTARRWNRTGGRCPRCHQEEETEEH